MLRRTTDFRAEAAAAADYASNPDKKVCPSCGREQSFAEVQGGVRRCPAEPCGRALYRPRMLWSEVQGSFLGRWKEGLVKKDKNLEKLDSETRPPFRVTHRRVFNRETGEMEEQEIPVLKWEEVGDAFLARQAEVVERLAAAAEAARAERDRKLPAGKPAMSKYKFSKPLPDFFSRQAAMLERRNMTFEERLDALKEV
jgi:rubredoxin